MFRRLWSGAAGILVVSLLFAGMATAQESLTGTVQTTTATTLTIRTDSGEEVTLDMDSSTHLPKSMTPGSRVRVNVREMGGQRLAGNVSLLDSGNLFSDEYATSTNRSGRPVETREANVASRTTVRETNPVAENTTPAAEQTYATNEPATGTQTETDYALPASDELPATAGQLPLMALTGLLALGGSVGIRFLKRR